MRTGGLLSSSLEIPGVFAVNCDPVDFQSFQSPTTPQLPTRSIATYTTSAIAPNAIESGHVALGTTFYLYSISTSAPAIIRLYPTSAALAADINRPPGSDISDDTEILFEGITTGAKLSFATHPLVIGYSLESPPTNSIALAITNLSTTTQPITVNLVHTPLNF